MFAAGVGTLTRALLYELHGGSPQTKTSRGSREPTNYSSLFSLLFHHHHPECMRFNVWPLRESFQVPYVPQSSVYTAARGS